MAIPLPHLDDLRYADLLDEARVLLPSLAPGWTNHNPSDPGVTLVELFAWLAEMVAWRANQLPDCSVQAFLKLLNGPGWEPGEDRDADVRATLATLRDEYRAVTPADYERLATAGFNAWLEAKPAAAEMVVPIARARCVPRRHLGAGTEAERARDLSGHVSVLVLPPRAGPRPPPLSDAPPPEAGAATRDAVWGFLEERRLLATRVHVVSPVHVPVRVEAVVVKRADVPDPTPAETLAAQWDRVPPGDVRRGVLEALAAWLDPLEGGPGGRGWPFGRDVHLSDLYALLEGVPGVDFVAGLRLSSPCPGADPGCVPAAELRHPRTGEQVGLALAAHHLPRARLAAGDVRVAAAAVPVEVLVSAMPAAGVSRETLERAVGGAVRAAFTPFRADPGGSGGSVVRAADVVAAVRALDEAGPAPVHARFEADPRRLLSESINQAIQLGAREVALPALTLHTDGRELWA